MTAAKKKDRTASGAAIAGAGGTTAGIGLVGGGIPGYKSDSSELKNIKRGSFAHRAGSALSSGRGGIFGYRTDAHQGFLNEQRDSTNYFKDKPANRVESFQRGQGAGKMKPEEQIIRHMKLGRRLSTAALVGGTAATAYGVHRVKHSQVKKSGGATNTKLKQDSATLLGIGGTTAGASYGGARLMEHQGRSWSAKAGKSIDEAARIVPNMGGHKVHTDPRLVINPNVPRTSPRIDDKKIVNNHKRVLAGKSKAQAEAAGHIRGRSQQERYFSNVYAKTGKTLRRIHKPALGLAAVGAGGLVMARHQDRVNKSAFGVEHSISKSLVNGVFKPVSQLSHAERAAVGGYKAAKGVSQPHQEFKAESALRHSTLKDMPAESKEHSYLHTPPGMKARGATYRLGSKKQGRSVVAVVGNDHKAMENVMSHERQHALPRRSEYRVHGQILKDPTKTMREEARADVLSAGGHYKKQKKAARRGETVSVYGAGAITGKTKHIKAAYPHMSDAEAKQGIKAYRETQNKIARAKGMKEAPWSRKKKAAVIGGGGVTIGGMTAAGGLEHHVRTKKTG